LANILNCSQELINSKYQPISTKCSGNVSWTPGSGMSPFETEQAHPFEGLPLLQNKFEIVMDFCGNYEPISTIFLIISLLSGEWQLGRRNVLISYLLGAAPQPTF